MGAMEDRGNESCRKNPKHPRRSQSTQHRDSGALSRAQRGHCVYTIYHVENADSDNPTYTWKPEEWYSFSGSKVMIDQATEDFSREDLPLPTVINEYINKQRKKFYKFT